MSRDGLEPKTKVITLRLSQSGLALIDAEAARHEMNRADWIRELIAYGSRKVAQQPGIDLRTAFR